MIPSKERAPSGGKGDENLALDVSPDESAKSARGEKRPGEKRRPSRRRRSEERDAYARAAARVVLCACRTVRGGDALDFVHDLFPPAAGFVAGTAQPSETAGFYDEEMIRVSLFSFSYGQLD